MATVRGQAQAQQSRSASSLLAVPLEKYPLGSGRSLQTDEPTDRLLKQTGRACNVKPKTTRVPRVRRGEATFWEGSTRPILSHKATAQDEGHNTIAVKFNTN